MTYFAASLERIRRGPRCETVLSRLNAEIDCVPHEFAADQLQVLVPSARSHGEAVEHATHVMARADERWPELFRVVASG